MDSGQLEPSAKRLASAFARGVTLEHKDGVDREPQDLIDKLVEHGLRPQRLLEILREAVPEREDLYVRVTWAAFREAYRARGRSEAELADRFFVDTLELYEEIRGGNDEPGDQDLARALLENARIAAEAQEGERAFALLQRGATVLGRDWKELVTKSLTQSWLEELGPSTTFRRDGR